MDARLVGLIRDVQQEAERHGRPVAAVLTALGVAVVGYPSGEVHMLVTDEEAARQLGALGVNVRPTDNGTGIAEFAAADLVVGEAETPEPAFYRMLEGTLPPEADLLE